MSVQKSVKYLRLAAAETINHDLTLADHLYDLADGLGGEKITPVGKFNFSSNKIGYNSRTRIKLLVQWLTELANIYESDITSKQLSYANDLIDEVEVGFLCDTEIESDFAKPLRENGFSISPNDAELSLQVRIVRIMEELMANHPMSSFK